MGYMETPVQGSQPLREGSWGKSMKSCRALKARYAASV